MSGSSQFLILFPELKSASIDLCGGAITLVNLLGNDDLF